MHTFVQVWNPISDWILRKELFKLSHSLDKNHFKIVKQTAKVVKKKAIQFYRVFWTVES